MIIIENFINLIKFSFVWREVVNYNRIKEINVI